MSLALPHHAARSPPSPSVRGFILCAFLLVAVLLAGETGAATLAATNLADNGPGILRQLIADASFGDTLDFAVTGTTTLTSGELVIHTNLTLQGQDSRPSTSLRHQMCGTKREQAIS